MTSASRAGGAGFRKYPAPARPVSRWESTAHTRCHHLQEASLIGELSLRTSALFVYPFAEEITAVDPGFATVLLVNGLALMPVAWFGSEEQKRKWLGEATSDPRGEYIAGWTVSEAAGTPCSPKLP
jgi:alkylation response protein AidB-like acyl-CoA dehydrogenase